MFLCRSRRKTTRVGEGKKRKERSLIIEPAPERGFGSAALTLEEAGLYLQTPPHRKSPAEPWGRSQVKLTTGEQEKKPLVKDAWALRFHQSLSVLCQFSMWLKKVAPSTLPFFVLSIAMGLSPSYCYQMISRHSWVHTLWSVRLRDDTWSY